MFLTSLRPQGAVLQILIPVARPVCFRIMESISYGHIFVTLYKEKIENNLYTKTTLTRTHIDLTAFSQMKVSVVAKVLSIRVAVHLEQDYG